MLECLRDLDRGGRSIESWPTVPGVESWISGAPISDDVRGPIQLFWDPEDEQGPSQPMYKAGIPMMTRALYEALVEAGVDNLQTVPVEVSSRSTQERTRDYVAFNVVGIVRAVDWKSSPPRYPGTPELIAAGLNGVTLLPGAAHGLLLFRLAENVGAIVIHNRVRMAIEGRFAGLTFVRPEDWAG